MAISLGKGRVELGLDSKKLRRGLRDAPRMFAGFGKMIGAAVGAIGLYKLVGLMRESIQLAGIQQDAEAKLANVLRATGNAAGISAAALGKYAKELQKVTRYGDEATIDMMAMLATFKNIRGDAFLRTTEAVMDMATVMGQDLRGALVMIAKAMNDPAIGLTYMSRAGVTFSESQKAMIKELVKSGKLLKAQGLILDELESQFGGAARAAGSTFAGEVEQLRNNIGDLKEEIGFALMPELRGLVRWLKGDGMKGFARFGASIRWSIAWAKNFPLEIKASMSEALTGVLFLVTNWKNLLRTLFDWITSEHRKVVDVLAAQMAGLVHGFRVGWERYKNVASDSLDDVVARLLLATGEMITMHEAAAREAARLAGKPPEFKITPLVKGPLVQALEEDIARLRKKIGENFVGALDDYMPKVSDSLNTVAQQFGKAIGENTQKVRISFTGAMDEWKRIQKVALSKPSPQLAVAKQQLATQNKTLMWQRHIASKMDDAVRYMATWKWLPAKAG